MPEIERPVDELYKDESLQDLSSDATNYNNKVESLNTDLNEKIEGVTTEMVDREIENETTSNIDLASKFNEALTGDPTSAIDPSDVNLLIELAGQIRELRSQGKTLGEAAAELKTRENRITDEGLSKVKKPIKAMSENIQNNLDKVTQSSSKKPEIKEAQTNVESATNEFNDAIDSGESERINEASRKLKEASKKLQDLLDKLDNLNDITAGSSWKKILLSFAIFLMKVGALFALLWIVSEQITGCYLFQGGDRTMLSNCSSWYAKANNRSFCSCNTLADMNNYTNPDCSNLVSDCNQPYCLGLNGCDATLPSCQFSDGIRLQCNKERDLTKSDSVYYSYQEYSPLSIINKLFELGSDVANEIPKLPSDFAALLRAALKYMGIFFGAIVAMYIVFQIIRIVFARMQTRV